MRNTVFYSEPNDFCRKYLVTNSGVKNPDPIIIVSEARNIESSLFEQFLLFDCVSLKVYGENIPLALLLNYFGTKGIESLIEQDAINFVLWNSLVTYMVDDIEGLDPLQSGTLRSEAHNDPETSLELGFQWVKDKPIKSVRKNLVRKLRDRYSLPEKSTSDNAVSLTKSAYNSGKLKTYGLSPELFEFNKLKKEGRARLCKCAEELLEYTHLINNNMTSYAKFEFYELFNDTNRKIINSYDMNSQFSQIAELENMPDLRALYLEIDEPFQKLLNVRKKGSSKKFRKWLAESSSNYDNINITKEYVDAIANSKGFFETKLGRFSKTIAMSTIGAGVGALVAGPVGALGGAGISKILEPAADLCLDMIDEFVIFGLTKGWSPKLFFNDIEALRKSNEN